MLDSGNLAFLKAPTMLILAIETLDYLTFFNPSSIDATTIVGIGMVLGVGAKFNIPS